MAIVFPPSYRPPSVVIAPWSPESLGIGLLAAKSGSPAAAAWPVANLMIFLPVRLNSPITVKKVWWENGATVSGNVELAVCDAAGNLRLHTGSTPQVGISTVQVADPADVVLEAGTFYKGLSLDNTTGTIIRWPATNAGLCAALGMAQAASAFPAPDPVTFALCAQAYIPKFGISQRDTF